MGLQQRQVFEDLLTTQEREVLHLCKLQCHRRQVDSKRQRRPPSLHLELANKGGRTETTGNKHVMWNALFLSLLFIFSLIKPQVANLGPRGSNYGKSHEK